MRNLQRDKQVFQLSHSLCFEVKVYYSSLTLPVLSQLVTQ